MSSPSHRFKIHPDINSPVVTMHDPMIACNHIGVSIDRISLMRPIQMPQTPARINMLTCKMYISILTWNTIFPVFTSKLISVVGKQIDYYDSKLFRTVAMLATNFEAYPKTNGTVQLNFTFHKLRKKRGDDCNGKSN